MQLHARQSALETLHGACLSGARRRGLEHGVDGLQHRLDQVGSTGLSDGHQRVVRGLWLRVQLPNRLAETLGPNHFKQRAQEGELSLPRNARSSSHDTKHMRHWEASLRCANQPGQGAQCHGTQRGHLGAGARASPRAAPTSRSCKLQDRETRGRRSEATIGARQSHQHTVRQRLDSSTARIAAAAAATAVDIVTAICVCVCVGVCVCVCSPIGGGCVRSHTRIRINLTRIFLRRITAMALERLHHALQGSHRHVKRRRVAHARANRQGIVAIVDHMRRQRQGQRSEARGRQRQSLQRVHRLH
mmetsp:Transcript_28534/g.92561  ORF Transcript_28534/g.92561 Transcript_28534/m.92561 type:complete len:303 (-) Transcript_28534:2373-3281(-)